MAETKNQVPVAKEKGTAATRGDVFWSPFESLRREMDRLFDEFHPAFPRMPSRLGAAAKSAWDIAPAVDVSEKDGAYEITAELPGMDEKDIDVKLASGVLTITGEKKEEKEEKKKDYYLSERRYGSFQRSFQVPDGVDAEKIAADFTKGVLKITLPKSAEAKQKEKKIAVKAS